MKYFIVCCFLISSFASAQNLLLNPHFDEGDENWTNAGNNTIWVDDDGAASGPGAIEFGHSLSVEVVSDPVYIAFNRSYIIPKLKCIVR